MTTDRTAIRRRLAVGGAAHRPPWRRAEGSVIAPLWRRSRPARDRWRRRAAIGRRRWRSRGRSASAAAARRRGARRQFALLPGEAASPRGCGGWRSSQLDLAIEQLAGDGAAATPADGGARDAQGAQAPARARAAARGASSARATCAREQARAARRRPAPARRARRRGDARHARRRCSSAIRRELGRRARRGAAARAPRGRARRGRAAHARRRRGVARASLDELRAFRGRVRGVEPARPRRASALVEDGPATASTAQGRARCRRAARRQGRPRRARCTSGANG